MDSSLKYGIHFRGPFFIRVPYYSWDLKMDPNFENSGLHENKVSGSTVSQT